MKKTVFIGIALIVAALLAGRLYLDVWVEDYINDQIDGLSDYSGSIEDIDIDLYRGAYTIKGLKLFKVDGQRQIPFFAAETIDLSVHWQPLLQGELVGEIIFYSPVVNFVDSKEDKEESDEYTDWTEPIRNLMPIRVNRLAVREGEVHFRDFLTDPNIDISLHTLDGYATNISNVEDKNRPLPSRLKLTGTSTGGGEFDCSGRLNILKTIPDFDIDLRFEGADLRDFNDFLRAYSNTDAAAGTFNLYVEIAVEGGQLTGYVKPLLTDVKLAEWRQDKEQPLKYVWELFAGMVVELFENQPRDQFATKVPLEGELEGPTPEIAPALWKIVSNAFIDALSKSTDNTIDFSDARQE